MSYRMLVIAKKIVSEMKDFYQVNEPIKVEKSDIETIERLIEQAEKVEQLQQENERLKKFLNWEQEESQGLDKEVTFQLEQLKQAQAKIERYEKALEFYADEERYKEKLISEAQCDADGIWISNDVYVPPIIYFDSGEKARQALEESK